jgi:hypothetical protein
MAQILRDLPATNPLIPRISLLMRSPLAALTLTLLALTLGCTNSPNSPTPEHIRHDTAVATSTVAQDLKGAAEGVRDGLHNTAHPDAVNINTASRPALETLPGVDPVVANLIIHHRPYAAPEDLVKKHVLTRDQYNQLSSRVTAN